VEGGVGLRGSAVAASRDQLCWGVCDIWPSARQVCGLQRLLQCDALTVAVCCSDGCGATMLGCLRHLAVYSLGVCVCVCVCGERGGGVWECGLVGAGIGRTCRVIDIV